MKAKKRIKWLNKRDPFHEWRVGQDVYCQRCEAVFKAEDVSKGREGLPECPTCGATLLDFCEIPFWREDLTMEVSGPERFRWKGPAIRAIPGKPIQLPPSLDGQRN